MNIHGVRRPPGAHEYPLVVGDESFGIPSTQVLQEWHEWALVRRQQFKFRSRLGKMDAQGHAGVGRELDLPQVDAVGRVRAKSPSTIRYAPRCFGRQSQDLFESG